MKKKQTKGRRLDVSEIFDSNKAMSVEIEIPEPRQPRRTYSRDNSQQESSNWRSQPREQQPQTSSWDREPRQSYSQREPVTNPWKRGEAVPSQNYQRPNQDFQPRNQRSNYGGPRESLNFERGQRPNFGEREDKGNSGYGGRREGYGRRREYDNSTWGSRRPGYGRSEGYKPSYAQSSGVNEEGMSGLDKYLKKMDIKEDPRPPITPTAKIIEKKTVSNSVQTKPAGKAEEVKVLSKEEMSNFCVKVVRDFLVMFDREEAETKIKDFISQNNLTEEKSLENLQNELLERLLSAVKSNEDLVTRDIKATTFFLNSLVKEKLLNSKILALNLMDEKYNSSEQISQLKNLANEKLNLGLDLDQKKEEKGVEVQQKEEVKVAGSNVPVDEYLGDLFEKVVQSVNWIDEEGVVDTLKTFDSFEVIYVLQALFVEDKFPRNANGQSLFEETLTELVTREVLEDTEVLDWYNDEEENTAFIEEWNNEDEKRMAKEEVEDLIKFLSQESDFSSDDEN
eukprot:maker-scaffold_29-snap-gene-2.0-mRNA-1 protein AED:0.01 eAED:0.01 QI:85/1/1/1/0.5/0.33/3/372/508